MRKCLCLTIHIATALHLLFSVSSLVVVDSVCTDRTRHARWSSIGVKHKVSRRTQCRNTANRKTKKKEKGNERQKTENAPKTCLMWDPFRGEGEKSIFGAGKEDPDRGQKNKRKKGKAKGEKKGRKKKKNEAREGGGPKAQT